MAKGYQIPRVGDVTDKEAGIKSQLPRAGTVVQFPVVAAGGIVVLRRRINNG